jgi:hypothetical protein
VVSSEDLVVTKILAGRDKELEDVRSVLINASLLPAIEIELVHAQRLRSP